MGEGRRGPGACTVAGRVLGTGLSVCGVLAVLRVVPYSAGFRCGQTPLRFAAYGHFASQFATEHTAGQGKFLKAPCFHSAGGPAAGGPRPRPRNTDSPIASGVPVAEARPLHAAPEPAAQPAYDGAAGASRGERAARAVFKL
jgi:hypothetical protein